VNYGLVISSVLLWIVVLLNLLLTFALIRRVNSNPGGRAFPMETGGPEVGQEAPPYTAETLDGEVVSSSIYADRAVALLVVSPGCQPCRDAIPSYEALHTKAKSVGVDLALVSIGDVHQTRELFDNVDTHLPLLIASKSYNAFAEDYNIDKTPFYCLINRQGKVAACGLPGTKGSEWRALEQMWSAPQMLSTR